MLYDKGYKRKQIDEGSNLAKAQLNLRFKPEADGNFTFSGMEEMESSMVQILIRANPKPNGGYWYIGNSVVPIDTTRNITGR